MQARGRCRLREEAKQTVRSKVVTAIDEELMQEGKQILSQDRYRERFIVAQTVQPLSLCALWSQAVIKAPPLAAVAKTKERIKPGTLVEEAAF